MQLRKKGENKPFLGMYFLKQKNEITQKKPEKSVFGTKATKL